MRATGWLCAGLWLAAAGALWGEDGARRNAPEDPDPSFLEFLGSVDGLAETNPDYLAQSSARPPPPGAQQPPRAATTAPRAATAPSSGEQQVKNHE